MSNSPTIGRIVWYRTDGRNGLEYDLPAIITCTALSHPGDYPDGRSNPLPVPESNMHVHLTVFTPGGVGASVVSEDDETIENPEDHEWIGGKAIVPGSGTYVELNVPVAEDEDRPESRSWRWPVRA